MGTRMHVQTASLVVMCMAFMIMLWAYVRHRCVRGYFLLPLLWTGHVIAFYTLLHVHTYTAWHFPLKFGDWSAVLRLQAAVTILCISILVVRYKTHGKR
jgi:hypothetical protein